MVVCVDACGVVHVLEITYLIRIGDGKLEITYCGLLRTKKAKWGYVMSLIEEEGKQDRAGVVYKG